MLLHIGDKHISSWSLRPWILLKMADIPFTEEVHAFLSDRAAQRRIWREFSPTAQVPTLYDSDLVIWDSLAICLYLGERYPQIWPDDRAARAWSYAVSAEMHAGFPALRTQCNFTVRPAAPITAPDAALTAELERLNALWTEGLTRFGGDYLAGGRFTVADAFYAPVVLRLHHYALAGHLSSAAQDYLARILALPALQAWCA